MFTHHRRHIHQEQLAELACSIEIDKLGEDDSKVSADPKWQELEKQHKGVFIDGTMQDEMRYVINMPD